VERAKSGSRFLIVMVADPEETGDTLRFDRAIESVQSAAETLGYSMHTYWIPWRVIRPRDQGPTAEEPRPEVPPADQPGVLIFRVRGEPREDPLSRFLVVFLVGESPVSGVQRAQFLNAVDHMTALSRPEAISRVYVAGPNFSGSFRSLKKAIDDSTQAFATVKISEFLVVSPSATVKAAGEDFSRDSDAGGKPRIRYHSVVHSDSYATQQLREYARQRWGLGLNKQAVVSESGTRFGSSFRVTALSPLLLQFPYGIFRLRNAYPEASARQLLSPGIGGAAEEERLRLRLRGPGPGRHSVPSFAMEQMPVAQEAVLLAVAATLRQEGIRLAQVVATDVFDAIFVAGFLRKAHADMRIYFGNADLLITRGAEQFPIEGSLAVTTFPLIARNQIWTLPSGQEVRALRPMGSRYEVGLFNSFRALVLEQQERVNAEPLAEYSFPRQGYRDSPPLWLTVVGTNGYWPIALLDKGNERERDSLLLPWGFDSGVGPAPEGRWPDPGEPAPLWTGVFLLLAFAALLLAVLVSLAQSERARIRLGSELLAHWAVRPKEDGALGRAYFALAECLVLGAVLLAMALPVWMLAWHGARADWRLLIPSLLAFGLLVAAVVVVMIECLRAYLEELKAAAQTGLRGYLWLAILALLGWLGFLGCWVWVSLSGAKLEGFFFSYRSLDLLNGVCPVMPFLFLITGYLVLVWLHKRRHALFLELPEELPKAGEGLEEPRLLLTKVREPLGHPLLSAGPLGWLVTLIGIGGMVFVFSPLLRNHQSLEGRLYDLLHWLAFLVFCVLVTLTWARFLLVWTALKPLLDRLASHPLRPAFQALAPGRSASPLLAGRGRYDLREVWSASVHVLRAFHSRLEGPSRARVGDQLKALEEKSAKYLELEQSHLAVAFRLLRPIQELLAATGTAIAGGLERFWSRGCPAQDQDTRSQGQPEPVRLGEEFIAIQYAAFVGNVILQLRNLLLFVTTGFFLAMVSALVYPFLSQQAMVWAGTASVVLLGIPVIVSIVQMETHPVLKTLSGRGERGRVTAPLMRLVLYGALPLLGIISSHFPALGRHLVWLLQPAMQAAR